jgi:hypothetical protein
MQHHSVPVEMYVYPNERHAKTRPISKYWAYQRNVDWMMFWLQEKEDADPSKRAQFARWRAMREEFQKSQSSKEKKNWCA